MMAADAAGKVQFEDGHQNSCDRFITPADNFVNIGHLGAKGRKDSDATCLNLLFCAG